MGAIISPSVANKKRVLFVDRAYNESSPEWMISGALAIALGRNYQLEYRTSLNQTIVNLIKSDLDSNHPFDALITHVPEGGLDCIDEIKRAADIPILAYSGADQSKMYFFTAWGVDRIIPKTSNIQHDYGDLVDALNTLLQEYRPGPPVVPPPRLMRRKGYTTIEATVKLRGGIDIMALGYMLKRSATYPGSIFLAKEGDPDSPGCDLRSPMDIVTMELREGSRIRLTIEGEGPESDKLALELYSGLSSRYAGFMDFDRFANTP